MDTREGMRVYARVVDAGSFSEAARRLGISKALASKYVGQLEQRLGVRLLNRTTRKLTPTEVGTAYYVRCARIVGEVEELESSLHADQTTPRGHLRIAGPRVFGEDALVGCVRAFLERHPAVTVDLVLEERTVDIVAEGFDLAVRIGELADTRLIARRITSYRYVLCASPDYIARASARDQNASLCRSRDRPGSALRNTDRTDLEGTPGPQLSDHLPPAAQSRRRRAGHGTSGGARNPPRTGRVHDRAVARQAHGAGCSCSRWHLNALGRRAAGQHRAAKGKHRKSADHHTFPRRCATRRTLPYDLRSKCEAFHFRLFAGLVVMLMAAFAIEPRALPPMCEMARALYSCTIIGRESRCPPGFSEQSSIGRSITARSIRPSRLTGEQRSLTAPVPRAIAGFSLERLQFGLSSLQPLRRGVDVATPGRSSEFPFSLAEFLGSVLNIIHADNVGTGPRETQMPAAQQSVATPLALPPSEAYHRYPQPGGDPCSRSASSSNDRDENGDLREYHKRGVTRPTTALLHVLALRPAAPAHHVREYAARRGFDVVAEFVDFASGARNGRPEYQADVGCCP